MSVLYYYVRQGQRYGPVPEDQLKQLAASGQLSRDDEVWSRGFKGWMAAAQVKGLFATAPATVPVARQGDPPPPTLPEWLRRPAVMVGAAVAAVAIVIVLISLPRRIPYTPQEYTQLPKSKDPPISPPPQVTPVVPVDQTVGDTKPKESPPADPNPKKVDPKATAALERGNASLDKGDVDKAIREYTEALQLQPGWAWAYCKRGQAYMNKKEYAKAIADCDEALKLEPKLIDALAFRAASQFDSGDVDAAIATADRALKIADKGPFFYFLRGTGLLQKGELDRAAADLTEAIRHDPKNPQYFNNRGVAYEKRGDTAKAQADYARRDALLGKSTGGDAVQLAKQRMEAAGAEFAKWQKIKDFEDEQISRARRMKIIPPPPDPNLAIRFNGAWVQYQQAMKAYEAMTGEKK